MTANSAKIQSVIENTFTGVIKNLTNDESGCLISDLYVYADPESGELQIIDEEEHLLDKIVIFDWVNNHDPELLFYKKAGEVVKNVLATLVSKNLFGHARFLKPFSVSLIDDDFEVVEELLFLDDNTFRIDDPLLKDLDAELDNFLQDLLSDTSGKK